MHNCYFNFSAKLDSPEDALQRSHKAVAITQPETESKASSSDSVIFICSKDKGNGAGKEGLVNRMQREVGSRQNPELS